MNWREQQEAYLKAMQNAESHKKVEEALNAMENPYDNGNLCPIFIADEEGSTYQVRILPNWPTPHQWWLDAHIYNYHPQGLKAGFSPKMAGQPDPFTQWLSGTIPYSEDDKDPVNMAFRGCWPSRRALAWVLIRTRHKDIDNNQAYVWSMPVTKGGFKNFIEPVIRMWGPHMMSAVDPLTGREAVFMVIGKGWQRSLANFNWVGDPCPAADDATLNHIFTNMWKPLHETFKQLTPDDMSAYIEYYEPIAEAFLDNPALAASFVKGPKDRGARAPNARQLALQYLKDKKTTTGGTGLPLAPVAGGPMPLTGSYIGAPAGSMEQMPQMPPRMPQAPAPGAMPATPPPHVPQMPTAQMPPMTAPASPAMPMPGGMPMPAGVPQMPARPSMAGGPPTGMPGMPQMPSAPMPVGVPAMPPAPVPSPVPTTAPTGMPPAPPMMPPQMPAAPSGPPPMPTGYPPPYMPPQAQQ